MAKLAVLELRRQRSVTTDQGGGRIVMALGLENLVAIDRTELADRPIDRADEIRLGQRPRAGLQWPREELVEADVAVDIGIAPPQPC